MLLQGRKSVLFKWTDKVAAFKDEQITEVTRGTGIFDVSNISEDFERDWTRAFFFFFLSIWNNITPLFSKVWVFLLWLMSLKVSWTYRWGTHEEVVGSWGAKLISFHWENGLERCISLPDLDSSLWLLPPMVWTIFCGAPLLYYPILELPIMDLNLYKLWAKLTFSSFSFGCGVFCLRNDRSN